MARTWTPDDILQLASSYQPACILAAAADLELFAVMGLGPFSADEAAEKLQADQRGMTILLDALAALQLLDKSGDSYTLAPGIVDALSHHIAASVLAMAQHQANCLRRWSMLAWSVRSGRPPEQRPSIRGADADYASFIEAMDNVSAPVAATVVADLGELSFRHLLDIGGASGSWTIAFLRAHADANATIFDLPHVIPQAEARIARAGLSHRVTLAAGDYFTDPLPAGADLAWVSAIVHQNSRQQNRALFERIGQALQPGGRILIRDILMEENRIEPVRGALFAVNMLTGTEQGGTYTFNELAEDLQAGGFDEPDIARQADDMSSVVSARLPA
jgi:precorrin-6B methylase 2